MFGKSAKIPSKSEALPGRAERLPVPEVHHVNGNRLEPPFPAGLETAMFALGCFWGAEKKFWQQKGVYTTAVGYAAGHTPNATYREVCSGMTGHAEVVLVVFDPKQNTYEQLLKIFWENHDPTQGMRQGAISEPSIGQGSTTTTTGSVRPRRLARRLSAATECGRLRRDHDRSHPRA